jgi:hypothetical protein
MWLLSLSADLAVNFTKRDDLLLVGGKLAER